ncbi:MAG TPA: hypothetical protein VI248_10125 [Kineosporiaceae bacterium]
MLRHTGRLITVLAVTTTFALADSAPVFAADQVPFKGHYAGVLDPPHGPPPERLTGSGNATHLGASTNSGQGRITGPANRCSDGFAVQNDEVLTSTDDGDQVRITTFTEDCPVSPGVFEAIGTFTVTGGTGRFAGASGGGNITGTPDLSQGTFEFSFDGRISRPKGG